MRGLGTSGFLSQVIHNPLRWPLLLILTAWLSFAILSRPPRHAPGRQSPVLLDKLLPIDSTSLNIPTATSLSPAESTDDTYDEPPADLDDVEQFGASVTTEDFIFENGTARPIDTLPFVQPEGFDEDNDNDTGDENNHESDSNGELTSIPSPTSSTIPSIPSPALTPTLSSEAGPFAFTEQQKALIPACSQISIERLKALQASKVTSVYTFSNGYLLAENETIPAPAKICIIFAAPQKAPAATLFPESPIPDKWPDTIHLYVGSPSVRFSLPPLRALPSQPNAHKLFPHKAVLYYADLTLNDEGVYEIQAENEAPNWLWTKHGWREASKEILDANKDILKRQRSLSALAKYTASGKVTQRMRQSVPVPNNQKYPQKIAVSPPQQKPQLPSCLEAAEIDANKGRWFLQQQFPIHKKQTADANGFSFDLDYCHLDYFSDKDMMDCLADKAIHIYGDSNSRRLSRVILSGGRWCHNITNKCQSEDNGTPVQKLVVSKSGQMSLKFEGKEHKGQFAMGDHPPFVFGHNSRLFFSFMTSMAYDPRQWLARFYDRDQWEIPQKKPGEKGTRPFNNSYIFPGARARAPKKADLADLVILSMSSWDDAFDLEYRAYERTLNALRDALIEAYPDPNTKIILRLNQGYCCRKNFIPANLRRFTGGRLQHFGDIAKRVFNVKGGHALDGRISVLDIAALTGRPEVLKYYSQGQLSNNHQIAAHVRTEAQLLFNSVCKRDTAGKASWKGG